MRASGLRGRGRGVLALAALVGLLAAACGGGSGAAEGSPQTGRPSDDVGAVDTTSVSAPSAAWVTALDGLRATSLDRPPLSHGSTLYLVGLDEADEGVLVALDAASGAERWRLAGVSAKCGVAVIDDQRVAAVAPAGGTLAGELPAVLTVDSTTGEVQHSTDWGRRPNLTYCGQLQSAAGILVVPNELGELTGWDVVGAPTPQWVLEEQAGLSDEVVFLDDQVVGVRKDDAGGREAILVDGVSGELLSTVALEGRDLPDGPHVVATGGDTVVVNLSGGSDAALLGTLSAVGVVDGELAIAWARPVRADDAEGRFTSISVGDGLVVAHSGGDLLALDLATGGLRWDFQPPGFRNTKAAAAVGDGLVVDGVFGGPFVFGLATDGTFLAELTVEEVFGSGVQGGSAATFGPTLPNGAVTTTSDADDTLVVALVAFG